MEEEASSPLKISHQIDPKPNFLKTSNKKGQETESKALVIFILAKFEAVFADVGTVQFAEPT